MALDNHHHLTNSPRSPLLTPLVPFSPLPPPPILPTSSPRVASNVRQALRAIEERAPSFALLDVNLGTETSFEIAERLLERNIPFAFATGYGEEGAFPEPFSNTPKYSKPYTADVLRAALAGT